MPRGSGRPTAIPQGPRAPDSDSARTPGAGDPAPPGNGRRRTTGPVAVEGGREEARGAAPAESGRGARMNLASSPRSYLCCPARAPFRASSRLPGRTRRSLSFPARFQIS